MNVCSWYAHIRFLMFISTHNNVVYIARALVRLALVLLFLECYGLCMEACDERISDLVSFLLTLFVVTGSLSIGLVCLCIVVVVIIIFFLLVALLSRLFHFFSVYRPRSSNPFDFLSFSFRLPNALYALSRVLRSPLI